MDCFHRLAELGGQIPPIREAHRPGTEDESTVPFDHQREVFGDQPGGGVERMQCRVELAWAVGRMGGEMLDDALGDLAALGFRVVERHERLGSMIGHHLSLLCDPAVGSVGVGTELDPVGQVERTDAEPPPELAVDDDLRIPPRLGGQRVDQRHDPRLRRPARSSFVDVHGTGLPENAPDLRRTRLTGPDHDRGHRSTVAPPR